MGGAVHRKGEGEGERAKRNSLIFLVFVVSIDTKCSIDPPSPYREYSTGGLCDTIVVCN